LNSKIKDLTKISLEIAFSAFEAQDLREPFLKDLDGVSSSDCLELENLPDNLEETRSNLNEIAELYHGITSIEEKLNHDLVKLEKLNRNIANEKKSSADQKANESIYIDRLNSLQMQVISSFIPKQKLIINIKD
jgi:CII-binding regulator of phage lambda lysogenization HflD